MSELVTPQVGDTWYRYEDRRYASLDEWDDVYSVRVALEMSTFTVQKVTPKGVWLTNRWMAPRFVLMEARKRFAHPTKEEALTSIKARKERQIGILSKQLENARRVIALANAESANLAPKKALESNLFGEFVA